MNLPYRKSTRLRGFDYKQPEAYFITICTAHMQCVLSHISVGEGLASPALRLLPFGEIARTQLLSIPFRFPTVIVDKYVIMPNHIHMILRLTAPVTEESSDTGGASPSPTVIDVVRAFKSITTRLCRVNGHLFQRSFHDLIIRTEDDYRLIWTYIDNNPARWAQDRFYCD